MWYNPGAMPFLLLLILGCSCIPPQSAEDAAQRLEQRLLSLQTLQADFQQTYYSSTVSTPLMEKGRVYIRRPGWMRFEYQDPEKKIFLIKGNIYQEYWPEDKQLVVRTLEEEGSEGALLALLSGAAGILDNYRVELVEDDTGRPDGLGLKLLPREEDADTYILLEIDRRDWLIHKAVSFDWTGNRQEFQFSRIKDDIDLPDGLFELKIPADVDIIR
jgi:outer membrane lipoprotein-sorting protein